MTEQTAREMVGLLLSINDQIKEATKLQPPNIPFMYPRDGGYKLLKAGETRINFFDGVVTLPDSSTEKLSNYLDSTRQDYVRSILFIADRTVDLTWDGNARYTIPPAIPVPLLNLELRKMHIIADANTNVRVLASTHPQGVPAMVGEMGGDPVARMGEDTITNQTYQQILSYTVTSERTLKLRSIGFNEGSDPTQFGKLQWRLTIAGTQQFTDKSSGTNFTLDFDAKIPGGSVVKVDAQSTDGTSINPEVLMTGVLI